jgi:hypothetical protein
LPPDGLQFLLMQRCPFRDEPHRPGAQLPLKDREIVNGHQHFVTAIKRMEMRGAMVAVIDVDMPKNSEILGKVA